MKAGKRTDNCVELLVSVLLAAVFVWGIVEAGYGLTQALGWRTSRHALYAMTGHFPNPGPFGGFIACVMAVAGAWLLRYRNKPGIVARIVNILAWVALGAGLLVLPASMSRAGWLALAAALTVEALRLPRVREWIRGHRWVVPAAAVLTVVLLVGAFLLKTESALGRLHIWRMECLAIADRPWTGAGPGRTLWAYGEAQEAFFRENLEAVSPVVIRAAGSPEFAFNEFLGLGVEYGLPALLLALALVIASIVVLHRAESPFAAGVLAWSLFACASYPLSVPPLRTLGIGFALVAVLAGCLLVRKRAVGFLPLLFALLLAGWLGKQGAFVPSDRESYKNLYSRGYALHQAARYEESTAVLELGAKMSCDPMFEVILGKNAEALGQDDKAEALYEKAHYMVPARLYPLVRQMRLQIRQGRNREALRTARRIAAMPVNDRHAGMVRLRKESMATLDSLKAVLGSPECGGGIILR